MAGVNVVSAKSPKRASSFFQRVGSILIPLPLVVGLAYWGIWPFTLLAIAAVTTCLIELYSGFQQAGHRPRVWLGLASGATFCLAAALQASLTFDLTGAALCLLILFSLSTELIYADHETGVANWALTFAGACYIGWLMSHYLLLRNLRLPLHDSWLAALHIPPGAAWVYLVLLITWFQDTTAYLVGKTWGRHKMSPFISPKKTWEGAAGGSLASVAGALLAIPLFGLPISYGAAALLGLAASLAGPMGDLAESIIKRRLGLKDMGNFMPGHGGLLDRVDSMLFTAPTLYYLILLLTSLP